MKTLIAIAMLACSILGCAAQLTITTNGVGVASLSAPTVTLAFNPSPTSGATNTFWWGTNSGAYIWSQYIGTATNGTITNNLIRGTPYYFNVMAQLGASVAFANEVTNTWPAPVLPASNVTKTASP